MHPIALRYRHNDDMKAGDVYSSCTDLFADLQAVANAAAAGIPVDPEVARRVHERSRRVQEELLRRHGVREIAVNLIRHGREEG